MTIFNWHEACRRPDVEFNEGLGVPTCSSCGCIATLEGIAEAQHHDAPFVPAPTTRFELTWPLSLPFVDDPLESEPPKETTAESKTSLPKDVRGNITPYIGQPTTSNQKPAIDSSIQVEAPYEPLFARKIRLLKLLKGNYNDPVRVELQVADLAIKPEYEALSYTWADENKDSSKCEKVYIGDRWDTLLVTKNCFNALRRLRYSNRSRKLWVDAICINQNDVGERSHQVGIMQNIYATASRVLIYLGEDEEDLNATSSSPWNFDKWNTYYERSLPVHTDLTQQPYFKRVWVIQEIAAAQDCWVLYGTKGDRWLDFRSSTKNAGDGSNQLHQQQDWFHLLSRGRPMDLQELPKLLQATLQCQATDPRDKVYALLGLFPGANEAQLTADYALSLDQVFSGLTAWMLCQSSAFMLPIFAALEPSASSLPASWVVDWSSVSALNNMGPHLPQADSGTYLISEPQDTPRFYRDGTMVLRGRFVSQLSSRFFDFESRKGPPGVLKDEIYRTPGTRYAEAVPDWAESTDEILEIKGLHDCSLVLRPVTRAPKTYQFVAIAKQPRIARLPELINHIDRTVILLFSTWQYVLRAASDGELWFQTVTWDTIKAVCWGLKHARNLEADDKGSSKLGLGCRLRARMRNYNKTQDWTPSRWATISELQNTRHLKQDHDLLRALMIMGWEYGAVPKRDQSGGYQRSIPWETEYFRQPRIRDFLAEFRERRVRYHDYDDYDSLRDDYNHDEYYVFPLKSSLQPFVKALLSQGLDQKIITFEKISRMAGGVFLRKGTLQEQTVPWAHDSLNLRVGKLPEVEEPLENIWFYGKSNDSHLNTWAAEFINSWTLLVNARPHSPDPPSSEIDEEEHGSENGFWATEKSIRTELTSSFTNPEVEPASPDLVSEVSWEPLLDLVRETEARLLPLEEAFTRTDITYDEDMKDVPWEDIRII
ncbi:hypothetical protein CTAM01_08503 [Colletotrichum tamarilloi]|uniref:Heterokaryon incompatibility domain-containing protein n=1 Tax=Colletotrichum tamarilloi TaxID=1209934 RepID=A0ABQ9R5N3_9PEZI|nr:uncharacterized protein CTAM01_08503 [Colletotrichum tamarilloi]KAK1495374.1 hypothetical protein CTAM01_08503 [Colletotrichum tamarilloi]